MNIRGRSGNFQFEEGTFSKKEQSMGKIYHEVLLLMKFLQTKPQIKNMKNNYCVLYYTVIKNRDENEVVNDEYENIENDYIIFNDFITPNPYMGIKKRNNKVEMFEI